MNVDWAALLTGMDIPPVEKIVRTIAVYLGILILVRLGGKRLLAQMNNLDLVVVLLLSNVVQNAIIGPDNSLVGGILGAVVLVAANAVLDRVAQRWPRIERLLEGGPTTIIRDGEVDKAALARVGLSVHDLNAGLMKLGADGPAEVELAQLIPGGELSVDLKRDEQAATHGELRDAVAEIKAYIDAQGGSR